MKYTLLLFIFISTISLNAQKYEGTIGKYPIFLEIDIHAYDSTVSAYYFYESQLKHISFEGECDGRDMFLTEVYSIDYLGELFSLSVNKENITGVWQKGDLELNVTLSKTDQKFDAYKLEKLDFIRDSVSTFEGKELVWFVERYSKNVLFRLGNGFTRSQREFLNSRLDSIHKSNAMIALECGEADFKIEMELVSDKYISFSEYSSIYCGGAHPSHNHLGYNFDIKNEVQIKKINQVYPHLNHYQLLKKKYGNDEDLQIECDYFNVNEINWEFCSWIFTKEGLVITPSYPHVLTPCEQGFLLSYKEIEDFK